MIKRVIIIVIFTSSLAFNHIFAKEEFEPCDDCDYQFLDNEINIDGVIFSKGTEACFYDKGKLQYYGINDDTNYKGKVMCAKLSEDTDIHGIFCSKKEVGGLVKFYPSARLQEAYLAKDTFFGNLKIPKDSQIYLYESGRILKIRLPNREDTLDIGGIKYYHEIFFYDSGGLRNADLAEDADIGGYKFIQGTGVGFYESGELHYVILIKSLEIKGVKLDWGDLVYFLKSGQPEKVLVGHEHMIEGKDYSTGSYYFFEDKNY